MANMIYQSLTRANGLPVLPFIQPYLYKAGADVFIDFSKIVPEPTWRSKALKMPNEEMIGVLDETLGERKKRITWYLKNWGTTSPGFSVRITERIVAFQTKWTPAVHVIQKLADMNDVSFGLEWADIDDLTEDYDIGIPFAYNVGKKVFKPSKRIIPFISPENSSQTAGAQ